MRNKKPKRQPDAVELMDSEAEAIKQSLQPQKPVGILEYLKGRLWATSADSLVGLGFTPALIAVIASEQKFLNADEMRLAARARIAGRGKYAIDSWSSVPPQKLRDALGRHLEQMIIGNAVDSESGLEHVAHALWNLETLHALNEEP